MCNICQNILLKSSVSKDWNTASLEWKENGYEYLNEDDDIDKFFCICDHHIIQRFEIVNKENGNSFWLGSKCIKNTFKNNKDLIYFVDYVHCSYCNVDIKRRSEERHCKSKKHLDLLEFAKKNCKQCKSCKFYLVPKTSVKHHLCITCFNKKVGNVRCKMCKKNKKEYKEKLCFNCYDLKYCDCDSESE